MKISKDGKFIQLSLPEDSVIAQLVISCKKRIKGRFTDSGEILNTTESRIDKIRTLRAIRGNNFICEMDTNWNYLVLPLESYHQLTEWHSGSGISSILDRLEKDLAASE